MNWTLYLAAVVLVLICPQISPVRAGSRSRSSSLSHQRSVLHRRSSSRSSATPRQLRPTVGPTGLTPRPPTSGTKDDQIHGTSRPAYHASSPRPSNHNSPTPSHPGFTTRRTENVYPSGHPTTYPSHSPATNRPAQPTGYPPVYTSSSRPHYPQSTTRRSQFSTMAPAGYHSYPTATPAPFHPGSPYGQPGGGYPYLPASGPNQQVIQSGHSRPGLPMVIPVFIPSLSGRGKGKDKEKDKSKSKKEEATTTILCFNQTYTKQDGVQVISNQTQTFEVSGYQIVKNQPIHIQNSNATYMNCTSIAFRGPIPSPPNGVSPSSINQTIVVPGYSRPGAPPILPVTLAQLYRDKNNQSQNSSNSFSSIACFNQTYYNHTAAGYQNATSPSQFVNAAGYVLAKNQPVHVLNMNLTLFNCTTAQYHGYDISLEVANDNRGLHPIAAAHIPLAGSLPILLALLISCVSTMSSK